MTKPQFTKIKFFYLHITQRYLFIFKYSFNYLGIFFNSRKLEELRIDKEREDECFSRFILQ
uniref:Uncharacterized protein n=1 Tax=Heterorhabditis bacteriophora TaxID=37862 RepID=A0A1I7WFL1_HETBA